MANFRYFLYLKELKDMQKDMINIFLEKLILLDKINKLKIEYLKGYMDAKINEKEEKN